MLPQHTLSFYLKQCYIFLGEGSCLLIIVNVLYVADSTASTRDGQLQCGIFFAIQMEVLARETLSLCCEMLRRNDVNLKPLFTLKNKA